ncbi:MAG TPA: DUF5686 family protein, partial [Puia sp.]
MKFLLLLGVLTSSLQLLGQTHIITGTITDASTHEPLRNASITNKINNRGTRSDSLGHFRLSVGEGKVNLIISMVGYTTKTLLPKTDTLTINLSPEIQSLTEVLITNKHGKYRNKDNPAVDLIRKVIANKDQNRPESFDYVSYEEYAKVQLSLRDFDRKKLDRKLLRPYSFLFAHPDTLAGEDTSLLYPVYLEEKLSNNYYQKNPSRTKQIITADKKVDYGDLVDVRGMSDYMNTLLADVDIYDNNVILFTNQFLSPISPAAPTYYEFYLGDTVVNNGERLVRLNFQPRNPDDFLFRGMLFVTLDGNYAVEKVHLTISKRINLNFIKDLHIWQEFEKTPNGHYYRISSDASANFSLTARGKGVHGRKFVSYSKLATDQPIPDSVF